MRNALAHVPKSQHTMVAAAIRQAFLQPDAAAAHQAWRHVADQLRVRWPKLGALMDDSEHDVLAYMAFPGQHRTKLHCKMGKMAGSRIYAGWPRHRMISGRSGTAGCPGMPRRLPR